MKWMKLTSIALSLTLAAGLFASCGGANGSAGGATGGEKDGELTLRFVSWQSEHKEKDQAVADAYHALHPNITVKYEYVGDMDSYAYLEKLDVMLLGNEPMDIVLTNTATTMVPRAKSGSYLPMDEFFEKEGKKADEVYNNITAVDGKIYSLPIDVSTTFVVLNKDMLDAAGLSVPPLDWTWDDYREYANKLTQGSGPDKVYGSHFHSWASYNYLGMYSNKLDNPLFETETKTTFDNPVFRDFIEFRGEMENVDGCQTPMAEVKSLNMNYRERFFNQKAAMFPTYSYMVNEVGKQDKFPHEFVTTFAPWPSFGPDGVPGRGDSAATQVCIPKTSKHAQEAYDYIRYFTTEGVKMRGVGFSAEKGVDQMSIVEKMIGDKAAEKYYDMEALANVLNNPDRQDLIQTVMPTYYDTMDTMIGEECDQYLLGAITLDECIANIQKRGEEIIKG